MNAIDWKNFWDDSEKVGIESNHTVIPSRNQQKRINKKRRKKFLKTGIIDLNMEK